MMPNKQLKLSQYAELKMVGDIDPSASVLIIEGYASVFMDEQGRRVIDRDNESVNTTFMQTENYLKNPVVVYNHNWGDVIGKVVELEKTMLGLRVKAEIHKLTNKEHIFEGVQKGLIRSFSIGFVPHQWHYLEDEDAFEVSEAELLEISLAPVQANQNALFEVTASKSAKITRKSVLENGNMTCDELSGVCKLKGKQMETKTPDVVEPAVQPKVEQETVTEAAPTAKKEEVQDAKPVAATVDTAALAAAVEQALSTRAEREAQLAAEAVAAQAAAEAARLEAEKQRVETAMAYLKQRKAEIEQTPAAELDTDEISDFYELVSDAALIIEQKVREAVEASQAA